ncbi:hypothetical protein O3G_MSEX013440 [Manduca sexta]|uniref:Kinetochore protein SPC25 n=1 Tax=Manduca sexta TaxID=7130 RepID=A0A921ZRP4_MANSE|nr:hypothetical protein O3G_MSEX013440 [Manduca sexta]
MGGIEDEWNLNLLLEDIEYSSFAEFEICFSNIHTAINTLLDNAFKLEKSKNTKFTTESYDEELKYLCDKNKILKQELDALSEQISKKQLQYEERKKDVKLFEQEIKDRHEAFLMAKKNYKKILKIYFTIESKDAEKETIFIQFFTEARKESENYSVHLVKDTKLGHFQILSTTPNLEEFKEIKRKLLETNDVPGALCSIRQAFKTLKSNKKHNLL